MLIEITHIIFTDFISKRRRVFAKSILATKDAIEHLRNEYIKRYGVYNESSRTQMRQVHFNYKEKWT